MSKVFSGWDYKNHSTPQQRHDRCVQVLMDLRSGKFAPLLHAVDTRAVHAQMFAGMTEMGQEYFAGHYRGEPFPYLDRYNITVGNDDRVGADFSVVAAEMIPLGDYVRSVLSWNQGRLTSGQDLIALVGQVCTVLVEFLRVHPFADGNGHLGRFLVWILLHAFGVHPRRWPLNDRPWGNYVELLTRFRDGETQPLVNYVLDHI